MKKRFTSLVATAFLLCSLGADAPGCTLGKPGAQLETAQGTGGQFDFLTMKRAAAPPWEANTMTQ